MKKSLILLFLVAITFSCMPGFKLPNALTVSARESYAKDLKKDAPTLACWLDAYNTAIANPRDIILPHGGNGLFKSDEFPVYIYRFDMQAGEILKAEVLTDSLGNSLFMELFNSTNMKKPLETNPRDSKTLEFSIQETGNYMLTVQPAAQANYSCTVLINKHPQYTFPVTGKSNSAIQSFWEAPRDGGKRRHEGIDIFAAKGTPVVAVTDGTISDTGDRGLGGKQVWQRAGLFGNSIYYAHLDQIAVNAGESVKIGDTLGYVGNTGNAKGGPPHLHFGIYKWQGAVDPLPFVYVPKQVSAKDFATKRADKKRKVAATKK